MGTENNYCNRQWLNPDKSSSTSSVVAFEGLTNWSMGAEDKPTHAAFLEISDCHGKIRLHAARYDTREEFTQKIRTLANIISEFADHLEK